MELGTLLILLLVLACPLMMVFMHRGGHGGHASHGEGHRHTHGVADETAALEINHAACERFAELVQELAASRAAFGKTRRHASSPLGGNGLPSQILAQGMPSARGILALEFFCCSGGL